MGRLKAKQADLQKATRGLMGPHQRQLLATMLRHVEYLAEEVHRLDEEIGARMRPFEEDLERLDTIPGVARRTAEQMLAEIGTNMDPFPSAAHLCAWAGLAPGNHESAGKRKTGKTRKGNQKLRAALVEAARAASRTKGTYLQSLFSASPADAGRNERRSPWPTPCWRQRTIC